MSDPTTPSRYPSWLVTVALVDRHGGCTAFTGTAAPTEDITLTPAAAVEAATLGLPGALEDPMVQRMLAWAREGNEYLDPASARLVVSAVELDPKTGTPTGGGMFGAPSVALRQPVTTNACAC